ARFRRSGRGHDGTVETVDVKGEVDGIVAERMHDISDLPFGTIAPPENFDALLVLFVIGGLAKRQIANADRNRAHTGIIEATANGGSVRVMFALIPVAQVGMRVEMQQG